MSFLDHTRHNTVWLLWTSDQLVADTTTWQHTTLTTDRLPFEPAIPANERSQTYALERAASGTGNLHTYLTQFAHLSDTICTPIWHNFNTYLTICTPDTICTPIWQFAHLTQFAHISDTICTPIWHNLYTYLTICTPIWHNLHTYLTQFAHLSDTICTHIWHNLYTYLTICTPDTIYTPDTICTPIWQFAHLSDNLHTYLTQFAHLSDAICTHIWHNKI